jgi:hypothetical protein
VTVPPSGDTGTGAWRQVWDRLPLIFDQAELYRDKIAPLLEPGERAELMVHGQVWGRDEPEPESPDQRPIWLRIVDVFLTGSIMGRDLHLEQRFLGTNARGAPDSYGVGLRYRLEANHASYCLVTDRRLLFVHFRNGLEALEVKASAPRAAVASARRRAGLLQFGRVELTFTDGSTLQLMTGIFFTRNAKRLVAVLTP